MATLKNSNSAKMPTAWTNRQRHTFIMSAPAPTRARFSLRTLFILITVICVAIGTYIVSKNLCDARRELRKLRNETGALNVKDPTKVHVIYVPVDEANTWRWRIFIPKGVVIFGPNDGANDDGDGV